MPPKNIDNCLEPGKSLIHVSNENDVMAFVDSAVNAFLRRHRFLSTEGESIPQKRRRIISRDSSWDETNFPIPSQPAPSVAEAPTHTSFMAGNLPSTHVNPDNSGDDSNRNTRTDPNPAATLITETSTHRLTSLSREEGEDEDTSQAALKLSRITIAASISADDKGEAPQWMVDALKDNSAYFVEERPIPSFSQQVQTDFPSENVAHEAYITRPRRLFDGSLSILDETSTWALQRDDISRMKVISQLDRKFIVCVVDATSESNGDSQASDCSKRILVLVDQHAASERVRVEGYLKTLCHHFLDAGHKESQTTFRVKLEPPHPVLLSRREVSMLRSSSQILQRWGFDLSWPEIENRDQNVDQEAVLVHSVPQVVGEKLLVGDELRNFLREHTEQSGIDDVLPAIGSEGQETNQDSPIWHKALRWCPKGLLELVNSRACRGAIMFNDALSIDQCERLMAQLAETAFPFQCAHGRPSLVALTGTSGPVPRRDSRGKEVDWMESGPLLMNGVVSG